MTYSEDSVGPPIEFACLVEAIFYQAVLGDIECCF